MLSTRLSMAADDTPRVLLVRPAKSEHAVGDALVRVRGELVTDGFDVTLLETEPGTTSAAAMAAASQDSASATIGLFLSADGKTAELWVVDKLTAKTVVRQVNTATEPTEELAEVLAIRAVELLRASLLESVVAQRRAVAQPTPTATPKTKEKAERWATKPLRLAERHQVRFHLGEAMVWSPTQLGPAFLLTGRFDWLLHPLVHPRLSFIGLGTRPRVTGVAGEAAVQQGLGLVEVVLTPLRTVGFQLQITAGAGVWLTAVEGRASWPYEGASYGQWAFASDVGVGATSMLSHVLAIVGEAHGMLLTPNPVVRFTGHDVSRIGRPVVAATLSMAVAL